MNNNCNIVKDLMPLYVDGVCSAQSSALVEDHTKSCDSCRAELESMRSGQDVKAPDEKKAISAFGSRLRRKVAVRAAIWTAAAALVIAAVGFVLYGIEFTVPYTDGLITVEEFADGELDIHVNGMNYKMMRAIDIPNDDGGYDLYVTVYRNFASMLFRDRDESDNYMLVDYVICMDYNSGNRYFDFEGLPRRIYYVEASRSDMRAYDFDKIMSLESVCVWQENIENRE